MTATTARGAPADGAAPRDRGGPSAQRRAPDDGIGRAALRAADLAGARARRRREVAAAVVTAIVCLTAVVLLPAPAAGGILLAAALLVLARPLVFNRYGALFGLAAIVMFVPIRRYALPIPLPFALEPYRLFIVVVLVCVVVGLLIDPGFTWLPVRFGWPIGVFFGTLVLSVAVNAGGLIQDGLAGGTVGALVNLALIVAVLFVARQLLRTEGMVRALLVFLSWAGAVIGVLAAVEKVTRVNVFLQLGHVLPLVLLREEGESLRAGGARAYASAQHPIALAVLLCMLVPIGLYLAKYAGWPRNPINRKIVYGLVLACTLLGVVAAISRTAVVVLGVMFLVVLVFRPRLAGLLALIGTPLVLLGTVVSPKVVGTLVGSFLDLDGLVASQYTSAGWTGAGRLADLEPALRESAQYPFFGTGLGSRIVIGADANAFILDNQVLGTLLETGAVGVIGLACLALVPPVMLLVFAFRTGAAPRYAMLAFTLAVSGAGYATALFFYDAFGFMQTMLLLCLLLAVGAWVMTDAPLAASRRSAAAAAAPPGHARLRERVTPAEPARPEPARVAEAASS